MGNKASKQGEMGPQTRNNGLVSPVRESQVVNGPSRKATMNRPPIPAEDELERRFNEVLIQMDLPPERLECNAMCALASSIFSYHKNFGRSAGAATLGLRPGAAA